MRILFLNSEYPPLGGGAARANEELFRAFSHHTDIAFDCITSAIDDTADTTRPFPNVRLYRVPIGEKRDSLHHQTHQNLLLYLARAFTLSHQLRKQQPYDLVHAFFTVPAGFVAYTHRQHTPYIVSLRGSDVPGYNEQYKFIYAFGKPIFTTVWKHAAAVIANSEQLAQLARYTMPRLAVPVITNGIDTQHFSPAYTEPSTKDGFRLLCVARLTERKNIHLLLQSLAALRNQYSTIQLDIVGDGSQSSELLQLTEHLRLTQRVRFLGVKHYDELPELYRTAHLFVLPSKNEGMSNTAMEAMASGLPLILTDTGGGKQLASGNGILIPSNNQVALTDAIKQLVCNEQLRHVFRRASRNKALQYNWKVSAQQYLDVYERVLKEDQAAEI